MNRKASYNTVSCKHGPIYYILTFFLFCWTVSSSAQSADNTYSNSKQIISQGQLLFQENCASCHNFKQQGIGPNLSGVTAEVSYQWLTKFVRNPQQVISSGDKRAVSLLKKYKIPMPAQTQLKDAELKAILSFIHTQKPVVTINSNDSTLGIALDNPVPEKIAQSGLTLQLEEWATAPRTAQQGPAARINKMVVLNGRKERVFLEDIRGILYELKGNKFLKMMDLSKLLPNFIHVPGHATGFGSYAFHPDFNRNGLFYTSHAEKRDAATADFGYPPPIRVSLQWVVSEWKIDLSKADTIFTGTSRELLRINMPGSVHGMQEITFNPLSAPGSPDYGLLYIGIGDGGSAEDGLSQLCNSNSTPWASVLRIDPGGRNSINGKYGIPAINPFASDNDPKSLGEVFARGFRNPNRISWTPDGKMLITDIGLNNVEELNIGIPGADYGWPYREGTFLMNYQGKMNKVYALPANDKGFTYPALQYDHDEGNAISGGFVYTGKIARLRNKYIFGDIVHGRIFYADANSLSLGRQAPIREFRLNFNGVPSTFREITKQSKADLRFGVGAGGELFIYTKTDGKMWKIKDCLSKVNSQ
ncbi:MAG: c-type cytochrome [Pedobacter sp.]|nr:MAG: c-type cytochrome [Pedobacter sp.]